jgi:probable rRNA maturation factor
MEISISVEDPAWTRALPDVEDRCRAVALAALAADPAALPEGARPEVSLVLADDDTVRGLNRDWRGKDAPTNVLSFAALDDDDAPVVDGVPLLLGDVVLAFGTCAAEAAVDGKTLGDHLAHLVVHGVLHLLGYDHEDDEAGAEEMEALETGVLAGLGIADPYAPLPPTMSPKEGDEDS